MGSLNDTLTASLIIILLFGAVSLYLYTRIQQCEQKLNLVESILLDIKMSAELREYPELPAASASASASHKLAPSIHESVSVSVAEQPISEPISAFDDMEETVVPISPELEMEALPLDESKTGESSSKVSVNYESMTLAELKTLAKQRRITGASSMKRSQILEALHTSDTSRSDNDGILSMLAESSSSISDA